MSVLEAQVNFTSNFAWHFSVMKDNSSVLFEVKLFACCSLLFARCLLLFARRLTGNSKGFLLLKVRKKSCVLIFEN